MGLRFRTVGAHLREESEIDGNNKAVVRDGSGVPRSFHRAFSHRSGLVMVPELAFLSSTAASGKAGVERFSQVFPRVFPEKQTRPVDGQESSCTAYGELRLRARNWVCITPLVFHVAPPECI